MTAEDIISRVCAARGVTLLQLRGPDRVASIALARHEAMWLLRESTGMSFPEIGRALGGRDHSTAIFGIRKIQARVEKHERYGHELRGMARIPVEVQREAIAEDIVRLAIALEERKARLRALSVRRPAHARRGAA